MTATYGGGGCKRFEGQREKRENLDAVQSEHVMSEGKTCLDFQVSKVINVLVVVAVIMCFQDRVSLDNFGCPGTFYRLGWP